MFDAIQGRDGEIAGLTEHHRFSGLLSALGGCGLEEGGSWDLLLQTERTLSQAAHFESTTEGCEKFLGGVQFNVHTCLK